MRRGACGGVAGGALPLCACGAFTPEYFGNIEGTFGLHRSEKPQSGGYHRAERRA